MYLENAVAELCVCVWLVLIYEVSGKEWNWKPPVEVAQDQH